MSNVYCYILCLYYMLLTMHVACVGGLQGVIYASRSSKDAPSTVMYRLFDSWAANSDWQVSLPPGDEALAVTAGHSFSALATSQHTLRVFSPAGAGLPLSARCGTAHCMMCALLIGSCLHDWLSDVCTT